MKTENPIASRLRAALDAREAMIADLCRKGLATRNSYGHVDNRDNHPLRVPAWRKVDSEYWNALHEASEAGVITLHNHTFSWNK